MVRQAGRTDRMATVLRKSGKSRCETRAKGASADGDA
jgi:hypothetical protein